MKYSFLTLLLAISTISSSQEFKTYENGLIYSPYAMERLKGMVGEKNEEFRACGLNKTYVSFEQGKGRVFTLNNPNLKTLINNLKEGISYDDFVNKYANSKDQELRLLTKMRYTNHEKEQVIGIRERPDGNRFELLEHLWTDSKKGRWIWDLSNPEYVDVVYLEKNFSSTTIPTRYAKMIQYSECLIDTTSQIFQNDTSKRRWVPLKEEMRKKQQKFLDYVNEKFGKVRPHVDFNEDLTKEQIRARFDSLELWEKSKKDFVKTTLSKDVEFCKLLNDAYEEALKNKNSHDEFETYVVKYISEKKALALKRNRVVVGQCSMDNSPRIHAINIAQLAGESLNWDIFLRAHLNVLNDNVSRVSDGSWAWEGRQTYIKELEELNINVFDLMLGIAFRSENVADGHYFGSIGRLGRAIAESKDITAFEDELPTIISNENLDDYNRLLIFYLYDHLSYNRDISEDKSVHKKNRESMIAFLPEYLRNAMDD